MILQTFSKNPQSVYGRDKKINDTRTLSKEKLFKELVNTFIKEFFFWHYLQPDNFDDIKDTKIFIWVIVFWTGAGWKAREHGQKILSKNPYFQRLKLSKHVMFYRAETTNLGKKLTGEADFIVRLSLTSSTRYTSIMMLWNELWNEEHR